MLDLSAAFDAISHKIVLARMNALNVVRGAALEWLEAYLNDRTQSVMIEKVMSEAKTLKTGLPQGSLLGPFAFPYYTALLFVIARRHNIQLYIYADDTQLYLTFNPRSYQAAIKQMEDCLSNIRS